MVRNKMNRAETDTNISENGQKSEPGPFSTKHLLKSCEDQIRLVAEVDGRIGLIIGKLLDHEKMLCEKDLYIMKLENRLKKIKTNPLKRKMR